MSSVCPGGLEDGLAQVHLYVVARKSSRSAFQSIRLCRVRSIAHSSRGTRVVTSTSAGLSAGGSCSGHSRSDNDKVEVN